jgi:23S rRNA pseudouridine1911/1915/1917 synthase
MMKLEVLFEDNQVLVVNKPAGLLTQPSGTEQDSLEAHAKSWIKEKYQKPGAVFLHVLHRLDKSVSGVVLFARTSKALSRLNVSLRAKKFSKTYLALVEGTLPAASGSLEHYLIHDDYRARLVDQQTPEAKLARLSFKKIGSKGLFTMVEIDLETGRYHQIRAQFSAIGCPIVGDKKYGSHHSLEPGAIALHHKRLEFTHPVSQQLIRCEAPLPSYMKQ